MAGPANGAGSVSGQLSEIVTQPEVHGPSGQGHEILQRRRMLANFLVEQVRAAQKQVKPGFRERVAQARIKQGIALGGQLVFRDIVLVIGEGCIDAGIEGIPAAVKAEAQSANTRT